MICLMVEQLGQLPHGLGGGPVDNHSANLRLEDFFTRRLDQLQHKIPEQKPILIYAYLCMFS
jgi:hypothetical protein